VSGANVNRVERLIINLDTALPIVCNWDECDRRSRTPYQVRLHEHAAFTCAEAAAGGGAYGRHAIMSFCSESHLDYWVACSGSRANELMARHHGRAYGYHSTGNRGMNR
jgi:hypothetical protein